MSGQHGGYRRPEHPAPTSGPGALSRRTDGHQPIRVQNDQEYGDRKKAVAQQQAAPLPQQQMAPAADIPSGGTAQPYSGVPFGAGSQRPEEPITHGVDIGPGGGPEVLGMGGQAQGTGQMTQLLQTLSVADTTGVLAKLMLAAKAKNA